MRVLVTGGAGFIGAHVVEQLLDDGHDVLVVDALLPSAHEGVPEGLPVGATYRYDDLTEPGVAADAVAGVDAVCHQASMVGLGVDFGDVEQYVRHNDLATAALLLALHDRQFTGRFVLASSMVVYGEGRYRCAHHGAVPAAPRPLARLDAGHYEVRCPHCDANATWEPVGEDAPTDPRTVYAATKLHQEHLVAAYEREHPGASAVALRYHNVYGPGMPRDTPYAGVASIFRSALARGEAPLVFEDGGQTRDFVHVRDVARANVLALSSPGAHGPLNVASGTPTTVLQMAQALAGALLGPAPIVFGGARPGDVRHIVASPERAAREIGFRADIAFTDGIAELAKAPLRRGTG